MIEDIIRDIIRDIVRTDEPRAVVTIEELDLEESKS